MKLVSISGVPGWPMERDCECGAHFVIDNPADLHLNGALAYETECPLCGRLFVFSKGNVPEQVRNAVHRNQKPRGVMKDHW